MTNEEKQLLLIDLCARLPYGVMCNVVSLDNPWIGDCKLETYWLDSVTDIYYEIKPYLRSMSSLVGKELDECRATCKYRQVGQSVLDCATPKTIDYLIAHHFDYRGLIPMGLALEAPEDMYKTE